MAKDPIYPNALELVQKMSSADYFGSEEDKETRKKSGSFVPSEMYYTEEEKKDRFGGSVGLDGIMNSLSSFALMGGNKPSDLIPLRGQNTSDRSDDMWVDRYSGEIYKNIKLPDEYGGGFFKKIVGTSDNNKRLDALNERHSQVGETPLMGALGVAMLPADAKGLAYLGSTGIKAAYKYAAPKIGDAISDLRYIGEDAGSLLTGTAPRIEDASGVGAAKNSGYYPAEAVAARQNISKEKTQKIFKLFKEGLPISSISKEVGLGERYITQQLSKAKLTNRQTNISNLVDELFDSNQSYKENLERITESLEGTVIKGKPQFPIGSSIKGGKFSGHENIRKAIQKKIIAKNQLSVKQYESLLEDLIKNEGKMDLPDSFYGGFGEGPLKNVSTTIPNYVIARNTMKKKYGEGVVKSAIDGQAIFRKGPAEYADYKARTAASLKKSRNQIGKPERVVQLDNFSVTLSPEEKNIYNQVNFLRKTEASTTLKNNDEFQQYILKNDQLLDTLSYRVTSNGDIIPRTKENTIDSLEKVFDPKAYTQTFFETDHIMGIENANKTGVNLLRNYQTLPKYLNNSFKKPTDKFIAKLLKQEKVSDEDLIKLNKIIDKAEELGISLYVDNPGKLGLGNNKYVGAKTVAEKGVPYAIQTENMIKKYMPDIQFKFPELQGRAHYSAMTPDGVQIKHAFLASEEDLNKKVINPLRASRDDDLPYTPELIPGTAEYAVAQVLGSGDTDSADLARQERRKEFLRVKEERELLEESRDFLSSELPLQFHFTELLNPRKVMDNPLIRRGINANVYGAGTYLMELAETIVNGGVDPQQVALGFGGKKDESIPAQEGRIQFEEYFPYLHKAYKMSTDPLPETPGPGPTEQTYISVIDELNRGMDRGLINLSYDIFDLAFAGLDGAGGVLGKDTDFAGALKKSFDKMDKTDPESWVGKISAIGTEFGVPGGTIFKLVNRFRKILGGAAGTNLFAQQTWNLKGAQKAGAVISNIIKRSGTGAVTFGINDFVVGSQYNSMSEYFGDNPLLFDEKFNYEPEDVSNLSGNDLLMANFRNRLRFAADGAIIGGLFPLVGPAFKYGINPAARYVGGPAVGAGARVVGAGMTVGSKILATDKYITPNLVKLGTKGASLLGKDIISRLGAASASVFSGQNMAGQWGNFTKVLRSPLPKMEDWGMFKVTSSNPLEVGLKRFDKFLGFFRDRGNQTINNFYLTKRTEQFITAKSKKIEKLLKSIEVKSYDLANGFLKTNNKNITSPQGELYFMEQVSSYLKGQIPISKLPLELQSMAKNLSDEFDTIRKSFKDVLPEGELKTFLDTNLKEYMRHSFAAFSNPKYKIIDDIDNVAMIGERSESTLATALGKKGLSGTKAEVDAAFASIKKKDLYENALQYITKQIQNNPEMLAAAMKRPGGLLAHAKHHLKEIIAKTKIENRDPIEIMQNIARENLGLPELIIRTGDELPQVIKKFLGQQEGLRDSVVTTTASLLTQSANMRMYNKMLDDGLKNKWIFRTREEARAAGIIDPQRIASGTDGRMAGLTGEFNPKIAEHFASPEIATSIGKAEGGMFDDLYQNSFIQGLIAYKAGVQTMKTVFSPSTQARNFLSAGFFPLNMGHIGGKASVTDAFKMTMDDIFGAGRTVDEESLIRNISRKVELGVLDENIVVSELQAVLRDIKSGKLKSLSNLSQTINATALSDTATKLYAGGDNVWKWYGHEYVKSQLRDVGFKNVDEGLAYAKRMFNVDMGKINPMTGANKTMLDVIEEVAAYTVRETYPTYSKVPELVKVFRRIPFVGNFVSFPAEILRTSMATTIYGLKHVMDENPLLRQIGYRTLMGQSMALGGVATAVKGIGEAYTGISGEKMDNWKKNFAPEFMRNSYIIPIGKVPLKDNNGQIKKKKDGSIVYRDDQFRVFDMSRFAPYDLITSSVSNIMNRFMGPKKERLDPRIAEGEVMREFFTTAGPLYDLAGGTFFGTAIGFEPILPLLSKGRDKNGVQVFLSSDEPSTKIDKFMAHWFKTVKPGGVASAQKIFDAIQGDVQKGSGVPIELNTELFKLFGGSDVKIDMNSAFRYKIADFKSTFIDSKEPRYRQTADFRNAGPRYLEAQYNQMNKEAFNEQYQFYKAVRAARGLNNIEEKKAKVDLLKTIPASELDKKYLNKDGTRKTTRNLLKQVIDDSKLLNDVDLMTILIDRVGESTAELILSGYFKPMPTGIGKGNKQGVLNTRMNTIYRSNPGIDKFFPREYFLPESLEVLKEQWSVRRFEDYENESEYIKEQDSTEPSEYFNDDLLSPRLDTSSLPTETPPVQVADSGEAIPANLSSSNGVVNQTSGLTSTEEALLSPSEQLIRKTQRGIA